MNHSKLTLVAALSIAALVVSACDRTDKSTTENTNVPSAPATGDAGVTGDATATPPSDSTATPPASDSTTTPPANPSDSTTTPPTQP